MNRPVRYTRDDTVWVIYKEGGLHEPNEIYVTHSIDCGETWLAQPEQIPGGPYIAGWLLCSLYASDDGAIHAQFVSEVDQGVSTYYSYRSPVTGEWTAGEIAASPNVPNQLLLCVTMVVGSDGEVHMAGIQNEGSFGFNYGLFGPLKYWHGTSGNWSQPEAVFVDPQNPDWHDSTASRSTARHILGRCFYSSR